MADLGAASTRLPEWLITTATTQKCGFPPEDKHKLRPDCMIVEIPKNEVPGAGRQRKRSAGGQEREVRRQPSGRPSKVWVVEFGYSADTRYLEKVQEKTDEHEVLCTLLRAEGYEVILLPIVLGTAGTLY